MDALPLACGWRRHSHRFSLGARTRQSHTGENMKIEEHVSFGDITSFKVGGSARYLITVENASDVDAALVFASEHNVPIIPFGGGSNVLGQDGVLNAALVRVSADTIAVFDGTTLVVGAGASWDQAVLFAAQHSLWGVENLSGVPGTVGGAIVQNIGAYGAVLSETLSTVEVFDTRARSVTTLKNDECRFGYRTSIFKEERDRYVILSARFALSHRATPRLQYKDLAERFSGISAPGIMDIRTAVLEIRGKKFPPLSEYGTAGSYFLNPVLSAEDAARVAEKFPEMPLFQLPEGGTKVPLGWLFEHVLKLRGFKEGNIEAWREQSLVLVAHPGATAAEVKKFAQKIIDRAQNELGITLVPEVRAL